MTQQCASNVALVTGASSGIGQALAIEHAKRGGDLVLVARNRKRLDALANQITADFGVNTLVITQDLSLPGAANRIFDITQQAGISVSTLINNAGFGGHGRFHERELADDLAMIQVNIMALTELTHLYMKPMISQGKGQILNVSSTASFMPGPLQAVYYATKAFVTSFSQAIAKELENTGVVVTALCPGAVDTGFVKAGNLEGVEIFDNAKSPESVASIAYQGLEQGKLIVINERILSFMLNWVIPLLPRKWLLSMSQKAMETVA